MTRIIALVVFAQFICLSQSAQVKRASDACPGSNNKTSTSKEYAHLSKRTSGDSDFSKPKYQSIYAKNTVANTPSKRGKAIAKEERIVTSKPVRSETQATPIVKEEKNNSNKVSSEPEEEFVESTPSEKKTETSKPMDVIQTEKASVSETKPIVKEETIKEEGKTASSKKSDKSASKNGSTNSTDLTTTKATKQKQQKKNKVKKLRLGKKCATDCPEF